MNNPDFDDEILMAFADGEASEADSARVVRAMEVDPKIAARVEMFRAARARTAQAMKPLVDEPVPASLGLSVDAMIERDAEARKFRAGQQNVVDFASRTRTRGIPAMPRWFAPLAATIVLTVGAAGGYIAGVAMPGREQPEFAAIQDPGIIKALFEIPSGRQVELKTAGRTLEPVLSFQLEDGTLCREFKLRDANARGAISIACLESDRWQTHLLMAATRPEEGYVPAGSAETIDAYLASIHASAPLDGTAEEDALHALRSIPH